MKSFQRALQLRLLSVEMLPEGLPIHAATERVGVYPTSQWSAKSVDVPVLPATGWPLASLAFCAVPSLASNTWRNTEVVAPATSSLSTLSPDCFAS